jgi:FAD/FMN-containing dehydrogenase
VKVGAGATWEDVLLEVNKRGKAILVKQASDVFSVGGSIGGINCHGWQHDHGSIASTVESIDMVDDEGILRTISRDQDPELFSCMFGTLGYFGVIVSVTLRVTENIELKEKAVLCSIEDFHNTYKDTIKTNREIPLLMGRLNINQTPLRQLYINTFECTENRKPFVSPNLKVEPSRGQRIERIFLDAVGHLPQRVYERLVNFYWNREVEIMRDGNRIASRNEIMHFGIKSFFQLHQSNLYTQWLQEYFVTPENLPEFLNFLGTTLERNGVRLLNASIRPTPQDNVSILPYAEKDRYAIVLSFSQVKTEKEMAKTKAWIQEVQAHLLEKGDKWYQAYMPYATKEEFETCYGLDTVNRMRELKSTYDPANLFSNKHTAKYFDAPNSSPDTSSLSLLDRFVQENPQTIGHYNNLIEQELAAEEGSDELAKLTAKLDELEQNHPLIKKYKTLCEATERRSSPSFYRKVFQTSDLMKQNFADFLNTIFFQLDEKKVFAMMEEILQDPYKTDTQIYEELVKRIGGAKKPLSFLSQLKALGVVRSGVGKQVALHLKDFEPKSLQSYLEVYNRRYVQSIQKEAGLSFKKTAAVCDQVGVGLVSRIEAGSLLYPYQKSFKLNDETCTDPTIQISETYKDLGDEISDQSLDVAACLGGFHHTPVERLDSFIGSLHRKLKPGAVMLVRDHNAHSDDVTAIAAVVHSFVNADDGWKAEQEMAEIRNFQPNEYWQKLIEINGFTRIDRESLVLLKDPTQNGIMMFTRNPDTKDEVEQAGLYQKNAVRSKVGSYATWLEWGNVRFSKQYAEFIQTHHEHEFDFLGHIYQHWTHFYHTIKQTLQTPGVNLSEALFSDNMAMNLFILFGTTTQLGLSALLNLPAALLAKVGLNNNPNLSALEKFTAEFQKDYSDFIDYDPFFKYPYFETIQKMWSAIYRSNDSWVTKLADGGSAIGATVSLGATGLASSFINSIYYSSDASSDLETIQVLLDDPQDELRRVIDKWNKWKNSVASVRGKNPYERCEIKVLHSVDGRKLISVPFYKPFTKFVEIAASRKYKDLHLLKVGGQDKITLDVCLNTTEKDPALENAERIYQMPRLQDEQVEKRRYVTYEVSIDKIQAFYKLKTVKNHVEYMHVHR